ncbi:MAG: histidinol-phosphate transaminase [Quinella sp. 2Q5]|nr:histidinol-phosphate transaminase [Quinella sp. 2Q5]
MLTYRNGLDRMPTYDGTEKNYRIKVNANESTMGLPPAVEERLMNRLALQPLNRYPGEEHRSLVEQLAKDFSVDAAQILLGNGSSEIIEKVFHAFGGAGKKVVFPRPSFSMYKIYANAAESEGVPFDLDENFDLDVDAFVAAVNRTGANLAVICNPNNPTGNALTPAQVEHIAASIDCAFLLDEAYVEFYGESCAELVAKHPNLLVARTFSKAFGLAGARVGYMLAQADVASMVKKTFMPYYMNVLSLAAADIVWQMRSEFLPRLQMITAERERMRKELSKIRGLKVFPSQTNFLLIRHPRAEELEYFLDAQGIGVRYFSPTNAELFNCLRISIGTPTENDEVLAAIKNFSEVWQ